MHAGKENSDEQIRWVWSWSEDFMQLLYMAYYLVNALTSISVPGTFLPYAVGYDLASFDHLAEVNVHITLQSYGA